MACRNINCKSWPPCRKRRYNISCPRFFFLGCLQPYSYVQHYECLCLLSSYLNDVDHLFTPSSNVAAWSNTRFLSWLDNTSYEVVITVPEIPMVPFHMLYRGSISDLHIIPEASCHFPFFLFYTCVYVWAHPGAHVCVLVSIVSCALIGKGHLSRHEMRNQVTHEQNGA